MRMINMIGIEKQLTKLLEPSVNAAGFELWGIEFVRAHNKDAILRIYIDHEDGIDVDDCAQVSHQVSAALDLEDPISVAYFLEVSSPGLERPLFKIEHFSSVIGEKIKLTLKIAADNRRNWQGIIQAVEGDTITIKVEESEQQFVLSNILKANLLPKF